MLIKIMKRLDLASKRPVSSLAQTQYRTVSVAGVGCCG